MLEVKNVTIAVGERVVAEDLSFIANDGELTCITGDAASGKTTLIRTLMGFLPVKAGFVSVCRMERGAACSRDCSTQGASDY